MPLSSCVNWYRMGGQNICWKCCSPLPFTFPSCRCKDSPRFLLISFLSLLSPSCNFALCSAQFDTSTSAEYEKMLSSSPTTHTPPYAQRDIKLFFDVTSNLHSGSCVPFSGSRMLSFHCTWIQNFYPTTSWCGQFASPKNKSQQPWGCSVWCRGIISPLAALCTKGMKMALPPSATLGVSCDLHQDDLTKT